MRKMIILAAISILLTGCGHKQEQEKEESFTPKDLVINTVEPCTNGRITVYADGVTDFEYSGEIKIKNDGSNGEEIEIVVDADSKWIER